MTKPPKVDILLPYWGDVELLKKAVGSVLRQTHTNWHLQVFDDCYPSREPADFFASLDDTRITYYRHEKNIGITKNFNYSLAAATADYCIIMGCDDMLLPDYLRIALLHIGEADFYQPMVEVVDDNDVAYLPIADRMKRWLRPKQGGMLSGEKLATSLCHGNWLYFPSILWKTTTLRKYGFDTRYKIVEDVVVELSIIKDGGMLSLDNATTFQYRRSTKSLSSKEKSKGGVRFTEEADVYNDFAKDFQAIGWKRAAFAAKMRVTSRLHYIITRFI